jgi:hypothetical protein
MPASSEPHTVVQLRISLEEVRPEVWRRLLVPGAVQLSELHDVFQVAMGWTNSHLHSFTIADELYGPQDDDDSEEELDERAVSLVEALAGEQLFHYSYDFGDSWEHSVAIEEVTTPLRALRFAVCLDGQRKCPPEDCGGASRYAHLLEVIADPGHEEFQFYVDWLGGHFDPEEFDLADVNARLQRLR